MAFKSARQRKAVMAKMRSNNITITRVGKVSFRKAVTATAAPLAITAGSIILARKLKIPVKEAAKLIARGIKRRFKKDETIR